MLSAPVPRASRRSAKKLKAPVDRCSCREESLANRLEQRWITHMRGLRKQAGGQIALCIDGKQLIELTCVSLDEFGGRPGILCSQVLASGHQVEDRIVDQRLNRY